MYRNMRIVSGLMAALAGVLVLSACASLPAANSADAETPHTISVTGSGAAYGSPDIANAQIGIESRGADVAQLVTEANTKMAAIIAAVKALGVEDKDIQTSNFSITAQQEYDPDGRPTGKFTYVVSNNVNVAVRDLTKVGDALGKAVEAGANSIYGVTFSVSEPAKLEAEARDKAMADAKARANQLAQAAGVTLGDPMTISEYSNGPIPYAADVRAVAGLGVDGSVAPVPVSGGQIQVNLQVSVVYLIR
jgi:uncharacterized protein YggE